MQYLSTETTGGKKKSARIKGTQTRLFYIFSPIPLRSLSGLNWFEMVENTLMEQWLKTSYYFKNALAGTHSKT